MTTDHHPAYSRAIRWIVGRKALHRHERDLNIFTEQSHRAIKQRNYPMRGFGSFESASRFCTAFDELNSYLMTRRRGERRGALSDQRRLFTQRRRALIVELKAA